MIEYIKHLFGFCGEAHPNMFNLIFGLPIISYVIYRIRIIFKKNNKKSI